MNQGIQYDIEAVMTEAVDTGLFVSLFTAQAPSGVFGPSGAPDGVWIDVPGLINIPCTAPPPSDTRLEATEVKALSEITAAELHHVLLNGYYPTLDLGWRDGWQCVLDGYEYDIMGVESDSQSQMTRVQVRLSTE